MSDLKINLMPASLDAAIAQRAAGRAIGARDEAVDAAERAEADAGLLAGAITISDVGEDWFELVAISPAQLIDQTVILNGVEIKIVEVITP
jgi:hypothetical protein